MTSFKISKKHARKFLVAYHGLDRYGQKSKNRTIMEIFNKLGSIQYDPLDICGKNAELVLQARVKDFKSQDLTRLLYEKRLLTEGWDKMMCIYSMSDYPFFTRKRDAYKLYMKTDRCKEIQKISGKVLKEIQECGPLSSKDLDFNNKIDWSWAPTKVSRATLEMLFFSGSLGIESRVHSRRVYDLVENLVPKIYLDQIDPNKSDESYNAWFVKRRIKSLGFYGDKSGDGWLGSIKKNDRFEAIQSLLSKGKLIPLEIKGLEQNFYMADEDMELLQSIVEGKRKISKNIRFLAPLDNFMWDRNLIEKLFGFYYRWEVYKPKKEREYAYYVLPVLYGDKLIARMEAVRNKKEKTLTIKNWWWEETPTRDNKMVLEIEKAHLRFASFLDVETDLRLAPYKSI